MNTIKFPYKYIIFTFLIINSIFGKVTLNNIEFKGNYFFDSGDLRDVVQSEKNKEFDARLINLDKILLRNIYFFSGFLDISIWDSIVVDHKNRNRGVNLIYEITEGQRYYFDSVDINGNLSLSIKYLEDQFRGMKRGDPFNQQIVNEALEKIENRYYNDGKPYIELSTSREVKEDSLLIIKLKIEEHLTVYIKNIIYVGLKRVQRFILTRETEFGRNEQYNRKKIENTQKNIYKTGLFDYVRIELDPIEDVPDSVNIIVKLKEKKTNWYGVHLGLAYEEDVYYGNKINVTLQGGNRNLFGTARSLSLHLTESFHFDFNDKNFVHAENEIFLRFVEPWIFYTRTPGVFQINYRQLRPLNSAPFNLLTTSFLVEHDYGEWVKGSMMISIKNLNNLSNEAYIQGNTEGLTPDQSRTYSLAFTMKRNRLDHFFNPRDGSRTMATAGLSDNVYFDPGNNKKHSIYFTLTGSWARYQPWRPQIFELPRFHFVLASRIRIGNIAVINHNDYVPQNDLFFAGGASTVRGYREQLLGPAKVVNERGEIIEGAGGKMIFLANIETRIPLFWLLMLEVFIDSGNVWKSALDFNPAEICFTTGAGIAFLTPIGPIRVDYGYKLNKPSTNPWPDAWHLGFYFAF